MGRSKDFGGGFFFILFSRFLLRCAGRFDADADVSVDVGLEIGLDWI